MRQEAVRKRVLAQEWAGTAMNDLTKGVARLHTAAPESMTSAEYAQAIERLLCLSDQLALSAEVATASVHVAANERLELNSEISSTEADIAREEAEVGRLRKVLQRERKLVERRAQYDALTKVILAEPEPEVSQKLLEEAKKEFDQVGAELAKVEEAKEAMSKDVALFLHTASNLDSYSAVIAGLCKGSSDNAMDTSA